MPKFTDLLFLPLAWATRLSIRFPRSTLAIALALTLVSLAYTAQGLGYKTSRADLRDPDQPDHRRWLEYLEEFGEQDDAVVVIEGRNKDNVIAAINAVAESVRQRPELFANVLHRVDLDAVRAKGLYFISPEELAGAEQFAAFLQPVTADDWSRLLLVNLVGGLCHQAGAAIEAGHPQAAAPVMGQLARLALTFDAALGPNADYLSAWPNLSANAATLEKLSTQYLLSNEGRFGFVMLRLTTHDSDGFVRAAEAIRTLRASLDRLRAQHPECSIGVTGLPIMEFDEMESSQSSMTWASCLSLFGVALLFVAGFGGLRHAMLANGILLMGMAWSFAFVTLTVGHLNILSVSFTAALIGIGIDYGVHYVARYLHLRDTIDDPAEALWQATCSVGPAIVTGAATTAVAFFTAAFTSFAAIAEMGLIAGGGVLICCAAELILLPAAIVLTDSSRWGVRRPQPLPLADWLAPLLARPRLLLLSTLAFTVIVSSGAGRLWYDHNLLNMQADGLESVELEKRLLTECDQNVWYAVSIADTPAEALARKDKLQALPHVQRVEEIASLAPDRIAEKQPFIERIHAQLAQLPDGVPQLPLSEPDAIAHVLLMAEQMATAQGDTAVAARLSGVRAKLAALPPEERIPRLGRLQQQIAVDCLGRLQSLAACSNTTPPGWSDLPSSLVSRFVSPRGRCILKVYGSGNLWDYDSLREFVHDIRSVDPLATGHPIQAYEGSQEMKRSYEEAAFYALIVILGVLWLNFHNIAQTLLAALPLGTGVALMFGLMGILDVPLNPANMIALPIILGIGVDYGVHLVHDYTEQSGRYRLSASTTVAIVVDSLTTIVGFGAMMIATHRGLESLGRILTLGVTCCLFTSLVMLPALLTWLSWNRPTIAEPVAGASALTGARRESSIAA